jgi:hypothetical protein
MPSDYDAAGSPPERGAQRTATQASARTSLTKAGAGGGSANQASWWKENEHAESADSPLVFEAERRPSRELVMVTLCRPLLDPMRCG